MFYIWNIDWIRKNGISIFVNIANPNFICYTGITMSNFSTRKKGKENYRKDKFSNSFYHIGLLYEQSYNHSYFKQLKMLILTFCYTHKKNYSLSTLHQTEIKQKKFLIINRLIFSGGLANNQTLI